MHAVDHVSIHLTETRVRRLFSDIRRLFREIWKQKLWLFWNFVGLLGRTFQNRPKNSGASSKIFLRTKLHGSQIRCRIFRCVTPYFPPATWTGYARDQMHGDVLLLESCRACNTPLSFFFPFPFPFPSFLSFRLKLMEKPVSRKRWGETVVERTS
jgi:hypothetical protein